MDPYLKSLASLRRAQAAYDAMEPPEYYEDPEPEPEPDPDPDDIPEEEDC